MSPDPAQYTVRPEAMRSAVGNVGGILLQAVTTVLELESLLISPTSFATIGASVAGQNTAMQAQQVTTLRSLLNLLTQINQLVKTSADGYDAADQAVSIGYGGQPSSASSSLWSSPTAGQLATTAMAAGTTPGQGNDVGSVLGYMSHAGMGDLSSNQFGSATGFANWLDASPDHQAQAGVIGVYSGTARDLSAVPGGVHSGDVVVVDHPSTQAIGVVGSNGQLYNGGPIQPDFSDGAEVRVYRPMSVPSDVS